MSEENRIYPRSSAFEALLAKVYLELWELQDSPAAFAKRVQTFVTVFLPSMFQTKVVDKCPDFEKKLEGLEKRMQQLEQMKAGTDSLTVEAINKNNIPIEAAEFAEEVWHAVVDVLTDAGFNFPMAKRPPQRRLKP